MSRLTKADLSARLGLSVGTQVTWSETSKVTKDEVVIQRLALGPRRMPALCLSPLTPSANSVGILYCHSSDVTEDGGKSEILKGHASLLDPLGLALACAGATVLCPDLAGFGERRAEGSESALAKAETWYGSPLIGRMTGDLILALEVLKDLAKPDKVATIGMSMGGILAYLVAALRSDVTACVHMCHLADMAPLIEAGNHDLHGPYMTIPGFLPDHDLSDIAAMIAPRPQLVITGAQDPITPPEAYLPAACKLLEAYAGNESALWLHRDGTAGHHETPKSRYVLEQFLAVHLGLGMPPLP